MVYKAIDTTAEKRVDVLVFAHRPLLVYASAAHGIVPIVGSSFFIVNLGVN